MKRTKMIIREKIGAIVTVALCQLSQPGALAQGSFSNLQLARQDLEATAPKYIAKKRAKVRVQEGESKQLGEVTKKRKSQNLWGYALGPYRSHYLGSESMLYAFSTTNHREVSEKAEVRFRFGASASEKGDVYMGSLSLGSAYLPLSGDITPILGAELGLGYGDGKNSQKAAAGFTGTLLAGLKLFRSSDTQLEILGRYEAFTSKNDSGFPATYGLQLAILMQ